MKTLDQTVNCVMNISGGIRFSIDRRNKLSQRTNMPVKPSISDADVTIAPGAGATLNAPLCGEPPSFVNTPQVSCIMS